MRWAKPLDHELIEQLADSHKLIVTLEENSIAGGAGSGVTEYLSAQGILLPTLSLSYVRACGLDLTVYQGESFGCRDPDEKRPNEAGTVRGCNAAELPVLRDCEMRGLQTKPAVPRPPGHRLPPNRREPHQTPPAVGITV